MGETLVNNLPLINMLTSLSKQPKWQQFVRQSNHLSRRHFEIGKKEREGTKEASAGNCPGMTPSNILQSSVHIDSIYSTLLITPANSLSLYLSVIVCMLLIK